MQLTHADLGILEEVVDEARSQTDKAYTAWERVAFVTNVLEGFLTDEPQQDKEACAAIAEIIEELRAEGLIKNGGDER